MNLSWHPYPPAKIVVQHLDGSKHRYEAYIHPILNSTFYHNRKGSAESSLAQLFCDAWDHGIIAFPVSKESSPRELGRLDPDKLEVAVAEAAVRKKAKWTFALGLVGQQEETASSVSSLRTLLKSSLYERHLIPLIGEYL